ncbi:unnamed protein product [Amoebophrya sp. A25]|nr:unnamed protein product [Amoebophrya sp. A25]|eukprot:GSA25T00002643001.1
MNTMLPEASAFMLSPQRTDRRVVHLYTDASLEAEDGMRIGGMIFSGSAPKPYVFYSEATQDDLPPRLRQMFHRMHIGVAEALAVRVALQIFKDLVKNSLVIVHVDNLGVVFSCSRNSARCLLTQRICSSIHLINKIFDVDTFFTWIASARNLADPLTRMKKVKCLLQEFNCRHHSTQEVKDITSDPTTWNFND